MGNLPLDTAERIRRNWDDLKDNHPEIIQQMRDDGTLRLLTQATNNQDVLNRNHNGRVNIRSVFVFGPDDDEANIVGVHHPWIPLEIAPKTVYATVQVGIKLDPRILEAILTVNDGVMPDILPPHESEE